MSKPDSRLLPCCLRHCSYVWLWSLGGAPGTILMGQVPWETASRTNDALTSGPPEALPADCKQRTVRACLEIEWGVGGDLICTLRTHLHTSRIRLHRPPEPPTPLSLCCALLFLAWASSDERVACVKSRCSEVLAVWHRHWRSNHITKSSMPDACTIKPLNRRRSRIYSGRPCTSDGPKFRLGLSTCVALGTPILTLYPKSADH